jgi:hypothetical protein
MLDVMLLAILIIAFKGIGVGSVEIKPGFYLYVVLVVGFLLLSLIMERFFEPARIARGTAKGTKSS